MQKKAFILELLLIMDNLERALGSGQSASRDQLLQGVEMTLQQLNRLLRAHGIEPEESVGQPFDPRYHEAVASPTTRRNPIMSFSRLSSEAIGTMAKASVQQKW